MVCARSPKGHVCVLSVICVCMLCALLPKGPVCIWLVWIALSLVLIWLSMLVLVSDNALNILWQVAKSCCLRSFWLRPARIARKLFNVLALRRGLVYPSESTIRAVTSVSFSTTLALPGPPPRGRLLGQSRWVCPGKPQPKHARLLNSSCGLGHSRVGCSPPQLPQRVGRAEPNTVFGGVVALCAWDCVDCPLSPPGGLRAGPPAPRTVLTLPLKPPARMAIRTWF